MTEEVTSPLTGQYTKATIFVPPALVDQVRQLAAQEMAKSGQVIDTMWPYPVSATGAAPAEMWMHTGFFGNQFFIYFIDPEVLAANTGMTLEQATGMQAACVVVEAEHQEALDLAGFKRIMPIDVNTSSQEELEAAPGIGASKALAIIDGRPWESVEALTQISGISENQAEELKTWYKAC